MADLKLEDAPNLDVLVVPGGLGQQDLMEDDEVLTFLQKQAETAQYVVSVCTGSLLLGAAGLLRGYRAMCHWMSLRLLQPLGAIPTAQRVVIDRNRVTAAGVSAGIDCALQLVSLLRGQEAAEAIQLQIEYDPEPPFRWGSPNTARESLVRHLTEASSATFELRRATVERINERHQVGPFRRKQMSLQRRFERHIGKSRGRSWSQRKSCTGDGCQQSVWHRSCSRASLRCTYFRQCGVPSTRAEGANLFGIEFYRAQPSQSADEVLERVRELGVPASRLRLTYLTRMSSRRCLIELKRLYGRSRCL